MAASGGVLYRVFKYYYYYLLHYSINWQMSWPELSGGTHGKPRLCYMRSFFMFLELAHKKAIGKREVSRREEKEKKRQAETRAALQ